jgi:hypothetical protein
MARFTVGRKRIELRTNGHSFLADFKADIALVFSLGEPDYDVMTTTPLGNRDPSVYVEDEDCVHRAAAPHFDAIAAYIDSFTDGRVPEEAILLENLGEAVAEMAAVLGDDRPTNADHRRLP